MSKQSWELEPPQPGDKEIQIFAPTGLVAVDYDDVDHDEAMRTARLIAAAPDLLEALQGVLPYAADIGAFTFDDKSPLYAALDKARAAIAKAKGEGL